MPLTDDSTITISQALKKARSVLENTSDSPALDAELLLAHCLQKDQTYLHTWPEKQPNNKQLNCFFKLINKCKTDYPVAYMLGHKAFWTFDLNVTEDVLIPRPETELLVEIALTKIANIKNPKILELGTGSGAIALALASERPDAIITASDNSEKALIVARQNAKKQSLIKNISFTHSDWYSHINDNDFDLIVSNPPYIDPDDPHLLETIRYEPQQALVSNKHGLEDIEWIIDKSKSHLKKGGLLILEHGYNQARQVLNLFKHNDYRKEQNQCDLNKNPRVSYAQYG